MSRWIRFTLMSLFVLMMAVTAFAQDTINEGDTIEGEASDDITEYEIELEKGAVIEISIEADWDTYLEVYDDNGDIIASDDDGGDGTQSLLVFTAPDNETYIIRVRAFGGDTPEGDYELSVEAIQVIQLIEAGELEYGDDEEIDADEALAIEATFNASAGDVVNIITVSDNYLNTIMTLMNAQGEEIAESDNYYGDAAIRRQELEDGGTYTIRIEEVDGGVLDGDIEVEVELTEILSMDNGAVTFEIGGRDDNHFVNFTAVDDTVYELTVVLDDEPDIYDVSLHILEEDQSDLDYSDLTVSMRGGRGLTYIFEAEDDGEFVIRLEYYGDDDIDVSMSIETIEE